MTQELPIDGFRCVKNISQFNEDFIENNNENSNEGYFLEVDIQYPEKLYDLHNDLPFLSERMKIGKVENLKAKLHDKKQSLKHRLVLKKESINSIRKLTLNHALI